MDRRVISATLVLCLAGLTSCGDRQPQGKPMESNLIKATLLEAPQADFETLLSSSEIPKQHHAFILSEVADTTYPFISVTISEKDGTEILVIDEFLWDKWTNPSEGTKGKMPHGRRTDFQWNGKEWEGNMVMQYGG